jgi:hypothetical protein
MVIGRIHFLEPGLTTCNFGALANGGCANGEFSSCCLLLLVLVTHSSTTLLF